MNTVAERKKKSPVSANLMINIILESLLSRKLG